MPSVRNPVGDTTDEWKYRADQERAHPHPAEEVHEVLARSWREHHAALEQALQESATLRDLPAHQFAPVGDHKMSGRRGIPRNDHRTRSKLIG